MPDLSHDQAVKGYWEEVKEKYPGLEYRDFERICKAPWNYFKECIRSGNLPVIMIKYLGKIRVYSGRVNRVLKWLEGKFERGNIDAEKYERRKTWLDNYLQLIKKDDEFTETKKKN